MSGQTPPAEGEQAMTPIIAKSPERLTLWLWAGKVPNMDREVDLLSITLDILAGSEKFEQPKAIAEAIMPSLANKGIVIKGLQKNSNPEKILEEAVDEVLKHLLGPEGYGVYKDEANKQARLPGLKKGIESRKNKASLRREAKEAALNHTRSQDNRRALMAFVLLAEDEEKRPRERRYMMDNEHLYEKMNYDNLAQDVSTQIGETVTPEEIRTLLKKVKSMSKKQQEEFLQMMENDEG